MSDKPADKIITSKLIPDSLAPMEPKMRVALTNRIAIYRAEYKRIASLNKVHADFTRANAIARGLDPNSSLEEVGMFDKLRNPELFEEELRIHFTNVLGEQSVTWARIQDTLHHLITFFTSRECGIPEGAPLQELRNALRDQDVEQKVRLELTNLFGIPESSFDDLIRCIDTNVQKEAEKMPSH